MSDAAADGVPEGWVMWGLKASKLFEPDEKPEVWLLRRSAADELSVRSTVEDELRFQWPAFNTRNSVTGVSSDGSLRSAIADAAAKIRAMK